MCAVRHIRIYVSHMGDLNARRGTHLLHSYFKLKNIFNYVQPILTSTNLTYVNLLFINLTCSNLIDMYLTSIKLC